MTTGTDSAHPLSTLDAVIFGSCDGFRARQRTIAVFAYFAVVVSQIPASELPQYNQSVDEAEIRKSLAMIRRKVKWLTTTRTGGDTC